MTMHIEHPDTHTHGLHDDCPKCQILAERIGGLDHENMARIWRGQCHNRLDHIARERMYAAAVIVQNLETSLYAAGKSLTDIMAAPPPKYLANLFSEYHGETDANVTANGRNLHD